MHAQCTFYAIRTFFETFGRGSDERKLPGDGKNLVAVISRYVRIIIEMTRREREKK